MRRILSTFLLASSLAGTGIADTIDVGPPGSGADFTGIQAAVDAAAPGDVIFVQPGTYSGFVVDKAVSVLGAGSDAVVVQGGATGVEVVGIPAGQTAVIAGMALTETVDQFGTIEAMLHVHDNAGTVVASELDVEQGPIADAAMVASSTTRVLVLASTLTGRDATDFVVGSNPSGSALHAEGSELWITDSTLTGGSAFPSGPIVADLTGSPGLAANASVVRVARSRIFGGAGGGDPSAIPPTGNPGAPAVEAVESDVTIWGGPANLARGGDGAPDFRSASGGPAVLVSDSLLTHASDAVLESGLDGVGGPGPAPVALSGDSTVVAEPFPRPTLATDTPVASLGATVALEHSGEPSTLRVTFASLTLGPTFPPIGFDGLAVLNAGGLIPLPAIATDATGFASMPLSVPAAPGFAGRTVTFQVAELGAAPAISSPTVISVVP